ncbi:MFS transporter [Microlunatus parietis]|uniref:Putative MFS family arabinose efflux permease n=1 Tax=Microlunatus parietis TaxID=682979 RepID=A0A7Y9I2M4_9ACTN|nr:MFS transporter [Microlunatus parietis]NYE69099.1 putative MFS family arabinose efflux permease [Microlunatus parietis]
MAAEESPDRRVLGVNRDFTLLWIGGAVSAAGSTATMIAMPLLILSTGTPADLGLLTSIVMVAGLVTTLPAGAWVDRADKRRLMLVCDLGRFSLQGVLAATLLTDQTQLLVITIVLSATASLGSLFGTAEDPAVRQIVETAQLPRALARNQARTAAAGLCGAPLGGVLFVVDPALPFAVSSAAFLFSFACIALIRSPMPPAAAISESSIIATITAGLRFVGQQPFLRATLIQMSGLNLVSNALWVITIVIIDSNGDHASAGLLMTMGGIGSLLGALVAPSLVQRLPVRTILVINRLVWAALIPLFLITSHPVGLGLIFAALFFIGPTGTTALVTAQMANTTEQMQGRASSARSLIAGLAAPAGAALIGLALQHFDRTASILALCASMLLLAVLAAASRVLRDQSR